MKDLFQFVFNERIREAEEIQRAKQQSVTLKQFYLTHFYPNTPIHYDKTCFDVLVKDTEIVFDENKRSVLMVVEVESSTDDHLQKATNTVSSSSPTSVRHTVSVALDWIRNRRNMLLFTLGTSAVGYVIINTLFKKQK